MSNRSDKELDRLSREAADSFEPDSSSLSWTRLEQKLIEQMPERPPDVFRFGQVKPWVWAPAVVLVAGISFYIIKNSYYSQHSTRKSEPVSQIKTKTTDRPGTSDVSTVYTDSISPGGNDATGNSNALIPEQPNVQDAGSVHTQTAAPGAKSDLQHAATSRFKKLPGVKVVNSDSDQTAPSPGAPNAFSSGTVAASSSGAPEASSSNAGRINKNSDKKRRNSTMITPVTGAAATVMTGKNAATSYASSNDIYKNPGDLSHSGLTLPGKDISSRNNNTELKREMNQYSLPQPIYMPAATFTVKGNDSLLNQLAQSETPVPTKSLHINRSLNFGFSLGPDYTDAGGITNNQLSNNIGLTVGYYLTNKISVNTGIFYSNKFYWSNGHKDVRQAYSQGTYATTTFAYAPPIEYVNGSCNMYELPLTLRYDFAKNEKTKFFVNAGVSSYFMLKQTYIYFFHSAGRGLAFKSADEAQVNYWFGMGDMSFGLETDMGKGFSFQAEPFFRIPLKQMGVENLRLYSYGLLISFRYAPVLSRTRK